MSSAIAPAKSERDGKRAKAYERPFSEAFWALHNWIRGGDKSEVSRSLLRDVLPEVPCQHFIDQRLIANTGQWSLIEQREKFFKIRDMR